MADFAEFWKLTHKSVVVPHGVEEVIGYQTFTARMAADSWSWRNVKAMYPAAPVFEAPADPDDIEDAAKSPHLHSSGKAIVPARGEK